MSVLPPVSVLGSSRLFKGCQDRTVSANIVRLSSGTVVVLVLEDVVFNTQAKPSPHGEVELQVSFWNAALTHVLERQMFVPAQVLFLKQPFPTAPTAVQIMELFAEAKH